MKKFSTLTDRIVPVHHPRVLIETAIAQGADAKAVLERSGLTAAMLANPDVRISYAQFGRLVHNALRHVQNPALGIDVGRNIGIAQMGLLGLALSSSPTVGAALDVFLRHYRSVAPAFEFELHISGTDVSVEVREAIALAPYGAFAMEMLLGALYVQGGTLYGGDPPVRLIQLAYPQPPHYESYQQLGQVPIEFGAPTSQIQFDASLLDAKIPFADPATARLAEEFCLRQLPSTSERDGLIAQIRRLLDTRRGPPPQLEEVARALQTSTRTLRRALHEMGTSFQQLVSDSQRLRAEEWIRTTRLPLEHIAAQLGFSDVRSFRRAFKRWTGQTPTEVRANEK